MHTKREVGQNNILSVRRRFVSDVFLKRVCVHVDIQRLQCRFICEKTRNLSRTNGEKESYDFVGEVSQDSNVAMLCIQHDKQRKVREEQTR